MRIMIVNLAIVVVRPSGPITEKTGPIGGFFFISIIMIIIMIVIIVVINHDRHHYHHNPTKDNSYWWVDVNIMMGSIRLN